MLRRLVSVLLLVVVAATIVSAQQPADPLIENTDDAVVLQQYAIEYYRRDQPMQALAALRKADSLLPNNAETQMWLGAVYLKLENLETARAQFERALELNDQLTEAHNWLGLFHAEHGDDDLAVRHYRAALDDPAYPRLSRARVQYNLALVFKRTGKVEQAVPLLTAATEGPVPSNDAIFPWIRYQLAEALITTGRPEEALAVLDGLDVLTASAEREYLSGLAYRDLGERGLARDHLQSVLRLAPGSEIAGRALGVLRTLESSRD